MALTQTVSYCYIMAVPTTQRGQADEKLIHANSCAELNTITFCRVTDALVLLASLELAVLLVSLGPEKYLTNLGKPSKTF